MVDYIKLKQQYWAKRKNIKLVPPSAKHKERTYTSKLEDNLFQPLSKKALGAFSLGGGNELGNGITPGKMQALHSSSAIAVNFFDYWTGQKDLSVLAQALKAPSPKVSNISFEQKYPISEKLKRYPPNLDVVLESTDGYTTAIECKYTEPYASNPRAFQKTYLKDLNLWANIPHIHTLSKSIYPQNKHFEYLYVEQLIKHILGLLNYHNQNKNKFSLIYLYYSFPDKKGYKHEQEIAFFTEIARKDNISYQSITWQELIYSLAKQSEDKHEEYLSYLMGRYS